MPRLLISAAHTMENPGQIFQDLKEADITRKLLKKTIPYLEQYKITFQPVPLDLPLLQRIEWINSTGYSEEQGDIFIEIHINDGGKRGIESWYKGATGPENKSQRLSETVLNGICKYTGYVNQTAKSEYDHELGSLLILNQINPIGTAVECLYIDNPEDIQILKNETKLDELAKAIVDGVKDYIDSIDKLPQSQINPNSTANPIVNDNNALASTVGVSPTVNQAISAIPPIKPPITTNNSLAPASSVFGNPSPGSSIFGNSSLGSKPFSSNLPTASNSSKSLVMDREERKEMIKKIYKKILGKEPTQSDLNYHLNTGTSEEDLTKKLLDGPEHDKILKDAIDYKEIKDKQQKMEIEIVQLQGNTNDLKAMHDNLNRLLQHKNMLIAKLQQELANNNIILSGQHVDSIYNQKKTSNPVINNNHEPKVMTLTQKIMKFLKI